MKTLFSTTIFISVISLLISTTGATAETASTYYKKEHVEQLEALRTKASNQVSKNLNRFGLETLKQYDVISDTLFETELRDTVASIETSFNINSTSIKDSIAAHRIAISKNEVLQSESQTRFFKLFRKSLLALGAWLLIVFVIIRIRNKNVRKAEAGLAILKIQSEHILAAHSTATASLEKIKNNVSNSEKLLSELEVTIALLQKMHEDLLAGDERLDQTTSLMQQLNKARASLNREIELSNSYANQRLTGGSEKVGASVNTLCDLFLEITYRGHCLTSNEPFNCSVSRDLEKNLQPMPVLPNELGATLLNVLDNAFLAVKERAAKGEKGYEPKVAISTRILPRFLQIRIKDNGDGISATQLDQVTDPFFTTRTSGNGAGVGLSEAKRLLALQNGEMVIESESGKGTDVYIKLFR